MYGDETFNSSSCLDGLKPIEKSLVISAGKAAHLKLTVYVGRSGLIAKGEGTYVKGS